MSAAAEWTDQALPSVAAWKQRGLRDGFEVAFVVSDSRGHAFHGHVVAVDDAGPWSVQYSITVDRTWKTRSVHVQACSPSSRRELSLHRGESHGWMVDGEPASQLDGCLDVDLEASVLTNALPIRRMQLERGDFAVVPAAYVRAPDLTVERLAQRYRRLTDDGQGHRYEYAAESFFYSGELTYDGHGLLVLYPGLAERVA